jgi:hypothetical protein
MKNEKMNCQNIIGTLSRRNALKLGGTFLATALLRRNLLAAD